MARLLPGQRMGKKLPGTGFVEAAQEAVCGKAMRQSGPVRELTLRHSGGRAFLATYAGKAWSVAPNSDQMTVGSSMGLAKVGKPLKRSSCRPNQAQCLQATMTENQDKTEWGKPAACTELFTTIRLRAGFRSRAMTNDRW